MNDNETRNEITELEELINDQKTMVSQRLGTGWTRG